ncbi:MAG: porin family protein [Lewinellaceae bacterium]|nr:porin family protein [Lewinellaceae bacterium]
MKKTLVLLALFAFTGIVSAQTQKGSVLLGATTNITGGFSDFGLLQGLMPSNQLSIGFGKTTQSYDGEKYTSKWNAINISPTAGYFVADGFMVGASLGFLSFGSKSEGADEENRVNIFSASPMLRYYFKQSGKVRPYAEARGGFMNVSSNDDGDDSNSATLYGAKVGGAIFIGDRTSLDLFLDYNGTSSKDDYFEGTIKTTTSVFGVGVGFSYFLK